MKSREIMVKRPWLRSLPGGYLSGGEVYGHDIPFSSPDNPVTSRVVTQGDFMREFDPGSHKIHDPFYYPDIYREETVPILDSEGMDTGKTARRVYKEPVPRLSFAFQRVIAVKQIVHLCGNDIQFDLLLTSPTASEEEIYHRFSDGWQLKNMECAFYEIAKSTKITGDGAVVGYLKDGVFGYRSFSYLKGDVLYPHYGPDGKLELFARSFNDYDSEGEAVTQWLEVYDKENYYLFKRGAGNNKGLIQRIFGTDGFQQVVQRPHGFKFCPVAYMRSEEGACWSASQGSIDNYEISFSQMVHNNQAYGFPIMYFQGEDIEVGHGMDGTIKMLTMGPDDKAGFLSGQSASSAFMTQLEILYKKIYEDSFTVIPPDVKSGDLPAAALKILYSPAYEKAMTDAHEYQGVLDDLVRIFRYGYGVECKDTTGFMSLPIKSWIKPYVHVSESAMVQDLATAVQNGFCSKETASERISFYTTPSEWDRILREYKENDVEQ